MNQFLAVLAGIGLTGVASVLVSFARRILGGGRKGGAAVAMYASQPFPLTVKVWLRDPDSPQNPAWRFGRLRITESSASWRPSTPFSKPVALTHAELMGARRYGLGPNDLRIPPSVLILVIEAGGQQVELALRPPNAEIVIFGLTHAGRGQTPQPGQPGVDAPTQSDT